jgi:hypothetical protein
VEEIALKKSILGGKVSNMNCRKEIRGVLIGGKMRRWAAIARCPLLDVKCSSTKARKNYWRLYAKYPDIARKLGLTVLSVYEPF